MTHPTARFTAAIALLMLDGCTADRGAYPSLAPRAVEKRGFAEPEPVTTPAAAPDPALDAKLATLSAGIDGIVADFAKASTTAQRSTAAAKGQKVGSDAWIAAQTDLAGLDDLHAQTSAAITEIEQLAIDRAAALAADYPALAELKDKAQSAFDVQTETITRLQRSLAPA